MKRSFKEKIKKFLTIFTTVVSFFVLISQMTLAAHSDHNCTGSDCVICEVIRTCENNNKQMYIVDPPTVEFENNNFIGETEYILLASQFDCFDTLINLKTKLSF